MNLPEHRDGPRVRDVLDDRSPDRPPLALVLHDDPRMVGHVHEVVAAEGLDAHTVAAPYRMLESREREVALVVLGVTALDDRDLELVPLVRDHFPHATLLVLYPVSLRERAAAALALGCDATLPEPFYPGELTAHAQHALARLAAAAAQTAYDDAPRDTPLSAAPITPVPPDPRVAITLDPESPTPVEQLALGVAHGINNPLQILELILGNAEAGDDLDVAELRGQLERIRSVADDLSRVGMRKRTEKTAVNLNQLVKDVFPARGRRTEPRCEIALDADEIVVQGEPGMLREALELLRRRAQRVTPATQAVRVATRRRGDVVEIEVTDGGPTLAPDELARFFQPKPDPDVVQEGTWLEMAVLAGIARNHRGTTEVSSTAATGTAVVVRLPSAREPALAR